MDINSAIITGTIKAESYSHYAHDQEFRKIQLESARESGTTDVINVIYQEKKKRFDENERIKVSGTLRSRRENKRLEIYVYADEIEKYDGKEINELIIEGHACTDPYYKETASRKLTQMLVCSENMRKAYVSVIVWKKTNIKIGQKVVICGRLQSRTYKTGDQERKINEISAYKVD